MTFRSSILAALRGHPEPKLTPAMAADPALLEVWITEWIAEKASIAPESIDRDKLFTDFGLDSLLAVKLSGALEQAVGRPLSPSIVWEFPTIAELAACLAAGGSGSEYDMDQAEGAFG